MNLNDNNDGMVPLYPPSTTSSREELTPPHTMPPPITVQPPQKMPEKNIVRQQMDSTPISDVMGAELDLPQDPRLMGSMMPQAPLVQMQKPQQAAEPKNKNPFNLTDKQMEALVAGVCAVIAFSKPLQEKLSTTIPQFLDEAGSRSTVGLVATGLIAALIYYNIQKFLRKD